MKKKKSKKRKSKGRNPMPLPQAQGYQPLNPNWDFESDLMVFLGPGWEAQAQQLLDQGQKRIILYGMPNRGKYPRGVRCIKNVHALVEQLKKYRDKKSKLVSVNYHPDVVGNGDKASDEIKKIIEHEFSRQLTDELWGTRWVQQALANLPHIARTPSIDNLRDCLKGIPAIVVAPGPSLERNKHLLKQCYGRAVIIAVNRSAKICEDLGVGPDMVVTVDPQPLDHHLRDMLWTDVHCNVVGLTCHPNVLYYDNVQTYFGAVNGPSDNWICDLAREDMHMHGAGSCTTNAMTLAIVMGCPSIITVGLDLSFPGGQQYAKGGEHNQLHERNTKLVEIPSVEGGWVATTSQMRRYAQWVADTAQYTPEVRWINATEGGALIQHMEYYTLQQVVDQILPGPVDIRSKLLKNPHPRPLKGTRITAFLEKLGAQPTLRRYFEQR